MEGQMTIFDLLYPDRIDPIREVAKYSKPMGMRSRQLLIDIYNKGVDVKLFAKAVRHEYCPYGAYGHASPTKEPNTMSGFDMRSSIIRVEYNDEKAQRQERWYSWEDFARAIGDMISRGEYRRES